jgi:hypothetical protein
MSSRLPLRLSIFLFAILVSGASVATAWPTSRLMALAARQDLSDEVRVALALGHGHISPTKRTIILMDAQKTLDPKEFEAFHRAFDRVAPPPPPRPVAKHPNSMAQQSSSLTRLQAMQLSSRMAAKPVVPAGTTQPDRIASSGVVR